MADKEAPVEKKEELSPEEESLQHHLVALATGSALVTGVNVRQFSLNSGKSILGFLVKELGDSFLVILPTSLHSSPSGEISASLVTSPPVCRFMKNSVMMTTIASDLPLLYYLLSIEDSYKNCPGFFTSARIAKIGQAIKELKAKFGAVRISSPDNPPLQEALRELADLAEPESSFRPPATLSSRTKH